MSTRPSCCRSSPPSPRNSGAKPRVASSQPDRATHCRIQITKPGEDDREADPAAEHAALEDVVAAGCAAGGGEPHVGQGDRDLQDHRQEDPPDQLATRQRPRRPQVGPREDQAHGQDVVDERRRGGHDPDEPGGLPNEDLGRSLSAVAIQVTSSIAANGWARRSARMRSTTASRTSLDRTSLVTNGRSRSGRRESAGGHLVALRPCRRRA